MYPVVTLQMQQGPQGLLSCCLFDKEVASLGQNPRWRDGPTHGRVVPVKHAKGIRVREAFEGQQLLELPRVGRVTDFLVVGGSLESRY